MLKDDFANVKRAKTQIRKAITRRLTGLTETEIFSEYPAFIESLHVPVRTVNATGLIDYCEDGDSNLTLNESITSIRDYAFADYTCLKNLVITSTELVELQGTHAFKNTLIGSGNGAIYVPANLVDTYKTAPNWSKFANLITTGTPPEETETMLIELEESVRTRTLEWFMSHTLEEIEKDNRI